MKRMILILLVPLILLCSVVTVFSGSLAQVYLVPEDAGLIPGVKQQFKVVGEDSDGNEVTVPTPVTWSVNSTAGSIAAGLFTPSNATGKYWGAITASVPGGFSATANVEVLPIQPQSGYYLERSMGSLNAGAIDAPSYIALDSSGNTYLVNIVNGTVNKLDSLGHFVSSISIGTGYNCIARDSRDGSFYALTISTGVIKKYSSAGTLLLQWGSLGTAAGQFDDPRDIAVDPNGRVLIADHYNQRIQVFNSQGQFVIQWPTTWYEENSCPARLTTDSSSNVYVIDYSGSFIVKYNSQGTLISTLSLSLPYVYSDCDIIANSAGGFYLLVDNSVFKVDASGNTTATWGFHGYEPGMFDGASSIALDSSGKVYVADFNNSRIQVFNSSGQLITMWSSAGHHIGQLNYPFGAIVDSTGNVYVADTYNCRVLQYDTSFTYSRLLCSRQRGDSVFAGPTGLAIDTLGNVLVSDGRSDRLLGYSSSGTLLKNWSLPPYYIDSNNTIAGLPCGIVQNSSSQTYVADLMANKIHKLDQNGTLLLSWGSKGSGNGQFSSPVGVGVLPGGNVVVSDAGNNRVQFFDQYGNYLSQWGTPGSGQGQLNVPTGMAVDSSGNIFVADYRNNRIQKFSSSGGYLSQIGSKGFGVNQLSSPQGVALDVSGNLYISDTSNHRLLKFVPYNPQPVTTTITSPTDASTYQTSSSAISIGGNASANTISVSWTCNRGGSGTCAGTANWSIPSVSLAFGNNVISVVAQDIFGTTATDTLTVTRLDTTAPTITITSPTADTSYPSSVGTITIGGSASDNNAVSSVTWRNDRGGSGTCTGTTAWSKSGITLQSGNNILTFTALDAGGNSSSASIIVVYAPNAVSTIAEAKALANQSLVYLSAKTVVAVFGDCIYIEESTKFAGVRVYLVSWPIGMVLGRSIDVAGSLDTATNGERCLRGAAK